jgi:SAM-dependent methyltransferase
MSGEVPVVRASLGRHLVGVGVETQSSDPVALVLFPGTVVTRVTLDELASVEACTQDFVVAHDALRHADDPILLLDAVHRVLRPAGTAVLRSPVSAVPDDLADHPWRDDRASWLFLYAIEQLGHRWELVEVVLEADGSPGTDPAGRSATGGYADVVVRRDPFAKLTAGQRAERFSRVWAATKAGRRPTGQRRRRGRPRAVRRLGRRVVRRTRGWARSTAKA